MGQQTAPLAASSTMTAILPFVPTSARTARGLVAEHLRRRCVAQESLDDTLLVVSELVANAIRHSGPAGSIVVDCTVDDSAVEVAVGDGGHVSHLEPADPGPRATSGRGLTIVDAVATRWWVTLDAAGTTVHAVLRVG